METLKIVSLFSGIGAFEQALRKCDVPHEIAVACDNNKFVKKSYLANYTPKKWVDDVRDVKGEDYKNTEIDVLIGGSPCQSFSSIGLQRGLEDTRGTLFYEYARVVKELQPKVFIYENVKGVLSNQKGETWKTMQNVFQELGYTFFWKVLNAKDFGVPQSRNRLYVIGFKQDVDFKFPTPIPLFTTLQDFLEENFHQKYILKSHQQQFVEDEWRIKKRYTQVDGEVALCQTKQQQFNLNGTFVSVPDKYFLSPKLTEYVLSEGTKNFKQKVEIDLEIARPILATCHKCHRAGVDNYVTTNGRIRRLTPKECLRLMGFPDDFKIVCSDTQMYQQSGNSIVVDVLVHIFKQILKTNPF